MAISYGVKRRSHHQMTEPWHLFEAMADQRCNKSHGQTYDGSMTFVKAMTMVKGAEIIFILQMVALARQHQSEHCKSLNVICFFSYFALLVLANILSSFQTILLETYFIMQIVPIICGSILSFVQDSSWRLGGFWLGGCWLQGCQLGSCFC